MAIPEDSPQPDRATGAAARRRSVRRVWLYGGLMLVPLLYFVLRYPLPQNIRLTDLGHMARYGVGEFFGFVLGVGALFTLYLLALREVRSVPARDALPAVFVISLLTAGLTAFLYPVSAIDVFVHYVWAHLETTHGLNPIAVRPRDIFYDPLMRFAGGGWDSHPSPYGPLWHQLAAPVSYIAGERVGLAIAGFKLLAVSSLLAGGWVIVLILRSVRPGGEALGAMFYLWNPLIIWEIAGNAHNDATMTLPLLLALLAWERRRLRWVAPLLVVSALIKYSTLLLLPLAAIALWRRVGSGSERAKLIVWSTATVALVIVVALYPFYNLDAIRDSVLDTSNIFLVSIANMGVGLLNTRFDPEDLKRWAKLISVAILLAVLAWQSVAVWRRPERLVRACFEVFFVFLVAVTWYFQGWYLTWPLALAALLPWGWPAWRMIAWTTGALYVYAVFIWVRAWWAPTGGGLLRYGVATIF
ncbi:MAG: hypothetical protein WKH64_09815, partial [Chloroflexia bacterium]